MTNVLLRGLMLAALTGVTAASADRAPAPARRPAADSILVSAQAALDRGQPWRASRLLATVLKDSAGRTPERLILAARAARAWGGANDVQHLLERERWLDRLFDGEGHALLAWSALVERRDSDAAVQAASAVVESKAPQLRAERQVLLARALDRLGKRDSAAHVYVAAAEGLPPVGDWLRLRAMGVTDDSAGRADLASAITLPHARARIAWTDALAVERAGDSVGAAARYASLGAPLEAIRLRLALAGPEQRSSQRRLLLAILTDKPSADVASAAVTLLEKYTVEFEPADQLLIARTLDKAGDAARAAKYYAAVLRSPLPAPADRLAYGDLLFRLQKYDDAIIAYKPLRTDKKLAGAVEYRIARAYVRSGDVPTATTLLSTIPERYPADTESATRALNLLADLATDVQQDAQARQYWRRLVHKYPTSPAAPGARFHAAIAAYVLDQRDSAAAEFDQLAERFPGADDATAALYWSGRSKAVLGDSAAAAERWQRVRQRDPRSYYAVLAATRLAEPQWTPHMAADSFEVFPAVEAGFARAALLERLGFAPEVDREYARLRSEAESSVNRLLATAAGFRAIGRGTDAVSLARKAMAKMPDPDARVWRLIYPLAFGPALATEAAQHHFDPALVAALVRQESAFDPSALSGKGARGLMQLLPEVGKATAKRLGYPLWDPALLYQPDVSLEIGTTYLADIRETYPEVVQLLAAYNAGTHRVVKWKTKGGVDDPELFAERIPFTETRDYVRLIQRNRQVYRMLYRWDDNGG
jgi:soluble lytic murein transglycosylase